MASESSSVPEKRPSAAEIRVGDVEREAVVQRLNQALGEGRLNLQEFEERSATAYAARTAGELAPLTADLPTSAPPPPSVPAEAPAPPARRRSLSGSEVNWLRVSIILVAIWAISSAANRELLFFWPVFPVGIWGAVLLANRLTGGRG